MLGLGGVVVVCGQNYNLVKIDRSVVFVQSSPLYFVFKYSKNIQGMTSLAL